MPAFSKKHGFRMASHAEGQILIELLIGIVVISVIAILITQMSFVGLRGTKSAGQQSVMIALAQEALETTEVIASADWHNVYDLTKSSQEYYPKISGGIWTLTTVVGDKTVTVNGVAYQRWVIIDNVQRNGSDDIVPSGGTDDPSTQKITATVTATELPTVTFLRYIARVRNSTARQTDWSGGSGQATNPTSGFDAAFNTQYDSGDGNLNTAGGTLQLLQ